ncbi:MAG TPA: hypothetical protein ENN11_00080 [Methanomicrobia archaeon]|nr:hypothetical protein [Methanomicrobia archaeon]
MILKSSETLKEVVERYNDDPLGWHVTVGRDKKGRSVVIFHKDTTVWHVKTHHITPYHAISVGGSAKSRKPPEGGSTLTFGWRPLSPSLMKRIRQDVERSGTVSSDVIQEISSIEPRPLEDLRDGVLQGPFSFADNPVHAISKRQKRLDAMLSSELDKLVFKQEGSTYG